MEQPDVEQTSKVSWFEVPVDDLDRATAFYGAAFGWRTPPMGPGAAFALTTAADEHGNATEPGGINGGFHLRQDERDAAPVVNISVRDVDAALEAVVAAGGVVVRPRTDIAEYHLSMALFADTEGNTLGVYAALQG